MTVRSFLGAFVFHSGGAFVDDGWLRVYGSPAGDDDRRLPSLAQVNDFPVDETADPGWRPDAGLVVAHDVVGGVFVFYRARAWLAVVRRGVRFRLVFTFAHRPRG